MIKKLLSVFLLFLALLAGVYYYTKDLNVEVSDPVTAIPEDAIVILKNRSFLSTWKQLSETNLMWQELLNTPFFGRLESNASLIDSLIRTNKEFGEIFANEVVWSSLHMISGEQSEFLYGMQLGIRNDDLYSKLSALSPHEIEVRKFEKTEIASLTLSNYHKDKLYFTAYKGILICSFDASLVENAVLQVDKPKNLLSDASFKKILETSGEYVDANLLMNYERLNKLLKSQLKKGLRKNFTAFNNYANWASLDVSIKPDALMFNGFTYAEDSLQNYLSCFSGQKPQDIDVLSMMPSSSSFILCFGVSNFEKYRSDYKNEYLKSVQQLSGQLNWLERLNKKYEMDLDEEITPLIGNEFAVGFLESQKVNAYNKYVVIRSSNPEKMDRLLDQLSIDAEKTSYLDLRFARLGISNFLGNYFGANFDGLDQPYFCRLNSYFIFTRSKRTLEEMIKKIKSEQTLNKDENFIHFSENLSSQSNILMYSNFYRSKELVHSFLSKELKKELFDYYSMFEKFEAVALQINSAKKSLFYQNGYLNYNPIVKMEKKSLWETSLDTTIVSEPFMVLNHYTKAKEIFVQDANQNVYLLDNKGNVLWKKALKEPIMSKVHQIDVYKNNKLQLLFNTASQLHLIDRNGNDVSGYPVNLKEKASTGITLIDYDKNRNYRILLPTEKRKVLNFSAEGKQIKGWKFGKTKNVVNRPIKYFSLDQKDYIVVADQSGHILILDRKGNERVKIKEKFVNLEGKKYFLEVGNDINACKLISTDSVGNITKLQFDDTKENVNVTEVSNSFHFEYQDMNNDKNYEYIFLDENSLSVFDHSKNVVFQVPFEEPMENDLQYFSNIGKYGRIGVLDWKNQQVYLYRDAGGLGDGFPINGGTRFAIDDINKDGVNDVVISLKNTIITYSLKK